MLTRLPADIAGPKANPCRQAAADVMPELLAGSHATAFMRA